MRERRIDSDSGVHNHRKHQPISYHQSQQGTKPLTMSMPRVPLTLKQMSVNNDASALGDFDGLTIPSPASPGTTRCPSLAESIYTQATCQSPSGSGPTTPTSEHENATHALNIRHVSHSVSRMYEDRDSHYISKSHSPPPLHRIPLHASTHTNSLQMVIHSNRLSSSMELDIPLMVKSHEEKISKQEKRRRNHLNSEKRRRENIKGGMDALLELVPYCKNIQVSKANILKKTKDYIFDLERVSSKAQMEVKRLNLENKELRKLLALQTPQHQGQPENLVVYRARS